MINSNILNKFLKSLGNFLYRIHPHLYHGRGEQIFETRRGTRKKMTIEARISATNNVIQRSARSVDWPQTGNRNSYPSEIYGQSVCDLKTLANSMPKSVYAGFVAQLAGKTPLDKPTADAVAHAIRIWAMDKGATHFTHWFQPQTGTTAEKHDSFLSLKTSIINGLEVTTAIDAFSGSQLMQAEPDASSFPNGGIRSTFEARGYTIWDTTSPPFIRNGPHGTAILYIPSCFISYNGEALDEKTILLRSSEALSTAAVKLLNLVGGKSTKRVYATLGTEQEFFLIDRGLYNLRPDLKICGRTLIGSVPPKHQQLEDHYFGQMPSRVLAAINESELELYKLGVPIKTRHNEVAPNQFEMAPIFEEAVVAVDHNLLVMETLHQVAHRHKLKVLFHEKPFKGVNGSGKHCNWSMSTDSGDNLLEPTESPENNPRFLLVLVAVLDAVYTHGGLLRASIASSSNEHRLGANEAPPGIMSVFLGEHLTEVLDAIEQSRPVKDMGKAHLETVTLGGSRLDIKVSSLPPINRDLTDRNRTSPFAFTGNKFEFRAVGSKQSPSFPVTLVNAAVAESLGKVTDELKKVMGSKAVPSSEDIMTVVRMFIKSSKKIRFEGNNYSAEWQKEASVRGLPNIRSCPVAFQQLLLQSSTHLLSSLGIVSKVELESRFHIVMEKYAKDLLIEANTLKNMIFQTILPDAYGYRKLLADSLASMKSCGIDISKSPELATFEELTSHTFALKSSAEKLVKVIEKVNSMEGQAQAVTANEELFPLLEEVRLTADAVEAKSGDKFWSLPKYNELLF